MDTHFTNILNPNNLIKDEEGSLLLKFLEEANATGKVLRLSEENRELRNQTENLVTLTSVLQKEIDTLKSMLETERRLTQHLHDMQMNQVFTESKSALREL